MPSEEQIKAGARVIQAAYEPGYRAALTLARRVLEAVEGKWDNGKFFDRSPEEDVSGGGPDHDGPTGKPFAGPTPVPCDHDKELRRLRDQSTLLNSLAWQMLGALGDRDPSDRTPVSGNPKILLDRLIAERDGLKILLNQVLGERDQALTEMNRLKDLPLSEPDATHEMEILSEVSTKEGTEIQVKCPYPGCDYETTVHARTAYTAHRVVDAIAQAHEQETDDDADPGA